MVDVRKLFSIVVSRLKSIGERVCIFFALSFLIPPYSSTEDEYPVISITLLFAVVLYIVGRFRLFKEETTLKAVCWLTFEIFLLLLFGILLRLRISIF